MVRKDVGTKNPVFPLSRKSPVLFLESGSKVFPTTCIGVLPAAMVMDSKKLQNGLRGILRLFQDVLVVPYKRGGNG